MTISTDNKHLSFAELVRVLQELHDARKTGTAYLLTDSKRYVRVGFKHGRIAQLVYGKYRGEDALEKLKAIEAGVFSFAENVVSGSGELPLPSTHEILQWLQDAAYVKQGLRPETDAVAPTIGLPPFDGLQRASSDPDDDLEEAPWAAQSVPADEDEAPPVEEVAPPPEAEPSGEPLGLAGRELYDLVTRELAMYLGPIAPMITNDHRGALLGATTSGQLGVVLGSIAAEIDDPAQADRFEHSIWQIALA